MPPGPRASLGCVAVSAAAYAWGLSLYLFRYSVCPFAPALVCPCCPQHFVALSSPGPVHVLRLLCLRARLALSTSAVFAFASILRAPLYFPFLFSRALSLSDVPRGSSRRPWGAVLRAGQADPVDTVVRSAFGCVHHHWCVLRSYLRFPRKQYKISGNFDHAGGTVASIVSTYARKRQIRRSGTLF